MCLFRLRLAPSPDSKSSKDLPAVPSSPQAPIDLLSTLLGAQLAYEPSERDAVILHHELCTKSASTGQVELFTSTLVQYGTENDSAMATTVGVVSRMSDSVFGDSLTGIADPCSLALAYRARSLALPRWQDQVARSRLSGVRGSLETTAWLA